MTIARDLDHPIGSAFIIEMDKAVEAETEQECRQALLKITDQLLGCLLAAIITTADHHEWPAKAWAGDVSDRLRATFEGKPASADEVLH